MGGAMRRHHGSCVGGTLEWRACMNRACTAGAVGAGYPSGKLATGATLGLAVVLLVVVLVVIAVVAAILHPMGDAKGWS